MKNIYRFENGHLYVLQGDSYVHCYHSHTATTKEKAIEEAEAIADWEREDAALEGLI